MGKPLKFGILTNPTNDILKEIKDCGELGFDFVEIGIEWPEGSAEIVLKKRKKIIELLKKYKLFAIAHTSWWIDISSPYKLVREAWIQETKRKIKVAHSLDIKVINFHTHSRAIDSFHKKYEKEILENFCRGLKELVDYGKKYDSEIILENATEKGEITDFRLIKRIVEKVPGVKIHLDIGHAFICGGMKNVRKFFDTFGKRIVHIHMHDNHGKYDEHLPIGWGKINYNSVVRMLRKINYDKTITFEVFTSKKDAVKSREKIKKLLSST